MTRIYGKQSTFTNRERAFSVKTGGVDIAVRSTTDIRIFAMHLDQQGTVQLCSVSITIRRSVAQARLYHHEWKSCIAGYVAELLSRYKASYTLKKYDILSGRSGFVGCFANATAVDQNDYCDLGGGSAYSSSKSLLLQEAGHIYCIKGLHAQISRVLL